MSRIVTLPPDENLLPDGARIGGWWRELDDGRLLCELCPRACHLKEGDRGFCFVRENRGNQMVLTTYGRSTGFCVDPIEKKPLNHFYPGTSVLSFGTAGCNLGCKFCQNWDISKSREIERLSNQAQPESLAAAARRTGCRSVAFTYNDPVIWAEYAVDCARVCRAEGIKTVAVTAGYITPEARPYFFSEIDAANVDLKGFTEDFYYRYTSSHLQPVLDTLEWLHRETNVWLEITNLIIPQANDAPDELRQMCDWILSHVGDEVPVHFTAFHPDFRLRDRPHTPRETLLAAHEIARSTGLKYIYVGNVHDDGHQSTYCPACGELLIQRDWYVLGKYRMNGNRCGACGHTIAGHFDAQPGNWGAKRMPLRILDFQTQTAPVEHPTSVPSGLASATSVGRGPQETAMSQQLTATAPQLMPEQQTALHRWACRILAQEITAVSAGKAIIDHGAELQDIAVEGAFVTLKRRNHLRACCGVLGKTMRLDAAVQQAAARTATQDVRLPPIALDELMHCNVDVTLLHRFQPLPADPQQRLAAVEIGRHGLQIRRGEQSGLLLPGVAVEHGWDAETLLRGVCRKAGMAATAWTQPDVELLTFEGLVVSAPFDQSVLGGMPRSGGPNWSEQEMAALGDFARSNVLAHFLGATPTYYLPGVTDANVTGVALTLDIPDSGEPPRTLSQLSFRPGIPLQATLLSLTAAAANMFKTSGWRRADVQRLRAGVTVLRDVAVQGTLQEPDLHDVDCRRHALLLRHQRKAVWGFNRDAIPAQLLEHLAAQEIITTPQHCAVYRVRVYSTESSLSVSNSPSAQSGPAVRPAAVAGTFYPSDTAQLNSMIDGFLEPGDVPRAAWPAMMVPHAGLRYSGAVAVHTFQRVQFPPTVLMICPKHTRLGAQWAIAPHERWRIPNGEIVADIELTQKLACAIPGLQLDAAAHQQEHAIEIELPLLHRFAPQTRLVAIAIGGGDLDDCRRFAAHLAEVIRPLSPRPMLVISSDMNHFAADEENRRLDRAALDAMASLDPELLYDTVLGGGISMCGVLPAVIVMETLRQLGQLSTCYEVDYATSGDVTGDRSRVVGYAGVLLK